MRKAFMALALLCSLFVTPAVFAETPNQSASHASPVSADSQPALAEAGLGASALPFMTQEISTAAVAPSPTFFFGYCTLDCSPCWSYSAATDCPSSPGVPNFCKPQCI
jgi:hypothetical protein